MIRRFVVHTVAAAALALSAGTVLASGTDAGGSAETGDAQAYNAGKRVYAAKLACSSCPLAGKSLNAAVAGDLLADNGTQSLSAEESKALAVYLKRRFKL